MRAGPPRAPVPWESTALGPLERWPAGLAGAVGTVLGAALPTALACGPGFVLVYNAAYAELLGTKHPAAFGRPAAEALAENWSTPGHGDVVARVYETGEPFVEAETRLPLHREGADRPAELVRFSRAYTAVRDDAGAILGVQAMIADASPMAMALEQVATLASRLASALSVDDVTREALRHAVDSAGADHARLLLAGDTGMRMARATRADLDDETATTRLPPLWTPVPAETTLPSVRVAQTGQPLWLDAVDLAGYPALDDEPAAAHRLVAVASVPLHTGSFVGSMSLGWEEPRAFSDADQAALLTVGSLIGQATARAQRFDAQRALAETLQRSMLPAELPRVAGLDLAARYRATVPEARAGGDFYDAFVLSDGRLAVTIGDVVGHDLVSTTVMGQVRAGLRVLAQRDPDPVRVLAGLDAFVADLGVESFVTALVAVLDPAATTLTVASAGHPPPLLRRPDGQICVAEYLAVPAGPPLGVPADRRAITEQLDSGDMLVLYTDGLVEAPGADLLDGMAQLRQLTAGAREVSDPRVLCGLLVDHLAAGQDDVAVLAVVVDDSTHLAATLDLPAHADAAAQARSWIAATLVGWDLPAEMVEDAQLCTTELVTNVLLHARSAARVDVNLDDHRLLVAVADAGTSGEVRLLPADPTAERGRGLLLLDAIAADWGHERTSRGTTVWFQLPRPQPATIST